MTRLTDKGNILIAMGQHMKEVGKMTFSTETAKKYGLMEQNMKVDIHMAKSTESANIYGMMVQNTKEIGKTIIYLEKY